jgi:dimethylhistidine N-methyltransferase
VRPPSRAADPGRRFDQGLRDEVVAGLRSRPRSIAPRFFYDDAGARLFERICEQPEYYLTRAELEILQEHAPEIARLAGPGCALLEYGSGAGTKVRLLLDALDRPASYTPIDISRRQLSQVARGIQRDYPDIGVHPVCADYTRQFEVPDLPTRARRLAFFPGSTIGNFHPVEATSFLRRVRRVVGPDGALIMGVDRVKHPAVLHAAYNDAAGITAEFNRNALVHLNRVLDADFDPDAFRHVAFFNPGASRIEMHLESERQQWVRIAGENIAFAAGERIWTESSYKYDRNRLDALAAGAGFEIDRLFTDAADRFWVAFLSVSTLSR